MLLASFGEFLFPITLVRQRVSVGAPKFPDHLALGHEGTFGLGILMGIVEVA